MQVYQDILQLIILIYISGYPYFKFLYTIEGCLLYRIYLGFLVIFILHESIHFCKRLLYLITYKMISILTIINNKREEGDWLFENIIFDWDNKIKKKKKINIEIALKLLNQKLIVMVLIQQEKKFLKIKKEEMMIWKII